jgi:hypothetical protein
LQPVIPEILDRISLLLQEIVHDLSEAFLGHPLYRLAKLYLLVKRHVPLWVVPEVIIIIIVTLLTASSSQVRLLAIIIVLVELLLLRINHLKTRAICLLTCSRWNLVEFEVRP